MPPIFSDSGPAGYEFPPASSYQAARSIQSGARRFRFGLGAGPSRWILPEMRAKQLHSGSLRATPRRMEILLLPNWLLVRLAIAPERREHVNAFVSSIIAVCGAPLLFRIPHRCLFQYFLHIPCPGCGVTHALLGVLRLDFTAAWRANPAGLAVAALLAWQILARPMALVFERHAGVVSQVSRHGSRMAMAGLAGVWILRLVSA